MDKLLLLFLELAFLKVLLWSSLSAPEPQEDDRVTALDGDALRAETDPVFEALSPG